MTGNGRKLRILGITGGVGAGKSAVLSYLAERYGACVIELDAIGREVIEPGGTGYDAMCALFGPSCLKKDGRPDRPGIAAIVFSDEEMRNRLNGIVHPAVRAEAERRIREAAAQGKELVVIESAILSDSGYAKECDEIWYICADEETRRKRLRETRGYTEERIRGIFSAQLDDAGFRAAADDVIDNSGSMEETERQIDERLKQWNFAPSQAGAAETVYS